jgi:hypothetical protein
MINCSTGFRTALLSGSSFNDIMGGGVIKIFQGGQPTSADEAEQGTFMGYVTLNGLPWVAGNPNFGIQWGVQGIAAVPTQSPLALSCITSGAVGWFRIVGNAPDSGELSLTLPRIDGIIAQTGSTSVADMFWGNTTLTAGSSYPIQYLMFVFPPL